MDTILLTGSWDLSCQIIFSRNGGQEDGSRVDLENDQVDVASEFVDTDDSSSEIYWSDDPSNP